AWSRTPRQTGGSGETERGAGGDCRETGRSGTAGEAERCACVGRAARAPARRRPPAFPRPHHFGTLCRRGAGVRPLLPQPGRSRGAERARKIGAARARGRPPGPAWQAVGTATSPLMKAFTALLTGLGAVLAFKVSASRTRSTSQTWKETYIPNDDPGSLYRVLPGLIERFQAVGLFPVFVVDELDK